MAIPASAYFQLDLLKAKKNNTAAKQWTLADWLSQRSKQRLADQWLALHSSSNDFELNLSAASEAYQLKIDTSGTITSTNQYGQVYRAEFFASIFNIAGEFEKTNEYHEAFGGAGGLRLLGTSSQSTSLVARYGWRRLNDFAAREHWESQYAEGLLRIYIFSFFGIDGSYRHYLPATSNLDGKLAGHRATGGTFIEVSILRIFAQYFAETMPLTTAAGTAKNERTGFEAGVTLLF